MPQTPPGTPQDDLPPSLDSAAEPGVDDAQQPDDEPELELNDLQLAYMQKMFATYQANLLFFKEKFPYVFKRLIEFDAEVPFSMDEEGKLTIFYKNNVGSPKDYVDLGKALYQIFDDPKMRPRVSTTTAYLENESILAPQAEMPYFYHPVEPEYRLRLLRRFKELCPNPEDFDRIASFGDKSFLITVIFGVGYGWDIEHIVDNYEIRHLIIIEPDARNLNLSLFFLDYISLYNRFMARGGKYVTFLTYDAKETKVEEDGSEASDTNSEEPSAPSHSSESEDAKSEEVKEEDKKADFIAERNRTLAGDLRQAIRAFWPPYMARGVALHFNDYRSEDVKEIWSALGQEFFLFYMGWGFFDDEVLSLLHATQNLDAKYPLCTKLAENLPEDSVAFVIGSGPSLDELLPLIEENKDRAIIVSCGTALTVLARKGIKPDFHVEIERTDLTYEFMADPKHREFIKDIPLLLIPAIPPGVFPLSNRPLMLLKYVDAGTQLTDIDNAYPRFSTGPTVTNCGTDFCLRMGIRKIYLAGVDMGYPNEGPHHSTLSHYYDEEHSSENLAEAVKQTDIACARRLPIPGNFGDEVHSTEIFIQARDLLSFSVRQFCRTSTVFNLNRGAAIQGTDPLRPEDFRPEGSATSKAKTIEAIFECFTTDYENNPDLNIANLVEQMDAVIMDAHQIFNQDFKNTLEVCDALGDFEHYLNAAKHAKTAVFPMLRGSMLHMCRVFFECLTMIKDKEVALTYAQEGIRILLEFMIAGQELIRRIPEEARRREQLRGKESH